MANQIFVDVVFVQTALSLLPPAINILHEKVQMVLVFDFSKHFIFASKAADLA